MSRAVADESNTCQPGTLVLEMLECYRLVELTVTRRREDVQTSFRDSRIARQGRARPKFRVPLLRGPELQQGLQQCRALRPVSARSVGCLEARPVHPRCSRGLRTARCMCRRVLPIAHGPHGPWPRPLAAGPRGGLWSSRGHEGAGPAGEGAAHQSGTRN